VNADPTRETSKVILELIKEYSPGHTAHQNSTGPQLLISLKTGRTSGWLDMGCQERWIAEGYSVWCLDCSGTFTGVCVILHLKILFFPLHLSSMLLWGKTLALSHSKIIHHSSLSLPSFKY